VEPDGAHCRARVEVGLATLRDLPAEDQDRISWQRTAELLLAAAEGSVEIEAATQHLERALFLQAKCLLPED